MAKRLDQRIAQAYIDFTGEQHYPAKREVIYLCKPDYKLCRNETILMPNQAG